MKVRGGEFSTGIDMFLGSKFGQPAGPLVGASGGKLLRELAFSAGIFFDCFFALVP